MANFIPPPLDSLEPDAPAQNAAKVVELPVTFYSLGTNVGGPDEYNDGTNASPGTNQGYSSRGQNLVPGVVAVNPNVIPHGTVLRDVESGRVFLASDTHGNADPNVVDMYVPPDAYAPVKTARKFEVAGMVDAVPKDAQGVRDALSRFGQVPDGPSAVESLSQMGNGKAETGKAEASGEIVNEFRRTNGAWEQKDPATIDWTAPARVIDEQVPRAQAAFTPPPVDSLEPEAFVPPPVDSLEPEGSDVASYWDKIKARWSAGREQAVDDQLAFRAMSGEVPWEQVRNQLEPSKSIEGAKGDSWYGEGFLGAVQMLPAMVEGITEGWKNGLATGAGFAGVTALAGQAGPQVAAPEEVITVPVAFGAGMGVGTAYGSSQYWYKQGAGALYHDLRKEGVPHAVSQNVAAAFGVPYAAVEFAQVSRLIPGKRTLAKSLAGAVMKRLGRVAGETGKDYVMEIGQETSQEILQIGAEAIGEWVSGVQAPADKAPAWDRIKNTVKQTAASMPFLLGPKAATSTVQAVAGASREAADGKAGLGSVRVPVAADAGDATDSEAAADAASTGDGTEADGTNRTDGSNEFTADKVSDDGKSPVEQVRPDVEMEDGRPVPVDETDASGDFVPLRDGETDWGSIDKTISEESAKPIEAAPIRVQQGWHDASGSGFGWIHAHDHEKAIKNGGWADVGSFIADTLANFNEIYLQPNGRLLLVKRNGRKQVAAVELRREGDFYGLTTAYPERANKDLTKKGELIWERSEPAASKPGEPGATSSPIAPLSSSSEPVALEAPNQSEPNKAQAGENVNSSGMAKPAGNVEGGFVTADIPQAIVDFGRSIYQAGMDFAEWSGRMIKELGESAREHLENLWKALVAHYSFLPAASRRGGLGSPMDNFSKETNGAEIDAATTPKKRRKFVQSVKDADGVLPEVKDRVEGVYTPVTNDETVAAANAWINEIGLDRAMVELMQSGAPSAKDYAAGIEMMGRLQAAGRFDDAAALAMRMAERATDQGRAIQALSLIARLSPQGIELYAAGQIAEAVSKSPRLERLLGEITRLKGELRDARTKLAGQSIVQSKVGTGESVQDRIVRLMVRNAGSLWGRYKEQAVKELAAKVMGPARPRGDVALEAFMLRLKRNLRDQMPAGPAKAAAPDVDEAAMLGEAVRNFDKYRQVWTDAQRYIQVAYRDNPAALKALDEYFGQILDRPFSDQSLDRAVSQVVDEIKTSMREILVSSAGDKAKARVRIAKMIVERSGLAGQEAAQLANAVVKHFDKSLRETRDGILRQMMALRADKVSKSKLQRLMEANNAGMLDDNRFFAALAKQYGLPVWTAELSAKVQALQRDYEAAKNPELKLAKAAQMMDAVHEAIPADVFTKARAVQNIALLLNPKTMIRNIGGNVLLFAADVTADSVSRWVVDPAVSIFTGERSRSSVEVAARMDGLAQPVRDFWNGYGFRRDAGAGVAASMHEGVKTVLTLAKLASRGKYELADLNRGGAHVLSSRAGRMLEDVLGVALSIPDRAFHQAAFKASIMRQMALAEDRGEALVAPTTDMIEEAMVDASRAVFQDENFASKALLAIGKGLNLATTFGKSERYGLGAIVLPFSQVPGSIAVRGAEWSPIGFIRSIYEAVRPVAGGEFRQKEAVDSLSRALLGTGVMAAGYFLAQLGILSALPDDDDDLNAMREASGFGKFRLNMSALKRALMTGNWWTRQPAQAGDVTVNYDWLQPMAMPVAMGAEISHQRDMQRMADAAGKGDKLSPILRDAIAGGAAGLRSLEEQPLLMGIARLGRDIGQHGVITGGSMQAMDAPGMFVPTMLSQVNQMMDNQVRETRAGGPAQQAANGVLAKIPGVAQKFPPKYDVFGEAQLRYQYGGNSFVNVMLNPAFLRMVKENPALVEASAIYAATGNTAVLPQRVPVKVRAAGQSVELTNEQISQYQRLMGLTTVAAYSNIAASPKYAAAPIGLKAEVMEKVMTGVHNAVKMQILMGNPDLVREIRDQVIQQKQAEQMLMQPAPGR